MQDKKLDAKKLCDAIGITEGLREIYAKEECLSTLVEDTYMFANYHEISSECKHNGHPLEHSREFYINRILSALEYAFAYESKETVAEALEKVSTM